MRKLLWTAAVVALVLGAGRAMAATTVSQALAEYGTPKYGADYRHFDYVNPAAPKGGAITLAEEGSFDSLNTLIVRGVEPRTLGLAFDSLMAPSGDELNVVYGQLAESVEYPDDRSWITFTLRKDARWHDGVPVTAEDVGWTFDQIRRVGQPFLKSFYQDVTGYRIIDPRHITFTFKTRNTMKPLVQLAGLTPLPKHWWTAAGRDISKTTLEPPLSSGPYAVIAVDPGRSITYQRVATYWGRDLPFNVGQNNFDRIRVDYYRDDDVMFQAFKAGDIDVREELRAKRWASGYDIPQVAQGRIEKRALPDERPSGIQAFFFNTRRARFADPRVRAAIAQLFDFEWEQKNLLFGQYRRSESFFPNSDYGASGPPTPDELKLLEPYRDRLPPQLFTEAYHPPHTDGSGNIRPNLRTAERLLTAAGWTLRNGRMVNAKGEPLSIEFLIDSDAFERLVEPFIRNLQRAGITATIRLVDSAQYEARLDDFDFDIVTVHLNFFPPPGTELRSYFGSAQAGLPGSGNIAGIRNPVVDALIETVIAAKDLPSLKVATRALDRVLLWENYVIPQWYNDQTWFAYWTKFSWPAVKPRYDTGFPATWWYDAVKAAKLAAR